MEVFLQAGIFLFIANGEEHNIAYKVQTVEIVLFLHPRKEIKEVLIRQYAC